MVRMTLSRAVKIGVTAITRERDELNSTFPIRRGNWGFLANRSRMMRTAEGEITREDLKDRGDSC